MPLVSYWKDPIANLSQTKKLFFLLFKYWQYEYSCCLFTLHMPTLQALCWATCFTIARTTLFTTAAPICRICAWWRRTIFTTTTITITLTTASHRNCTIFCSERITLLSAHLTWLLRLSSKIDGKVHNWDIIVWFLFGHVIVFLIVFVV